MEKEFAKIAHKKLINLTKNAKFVKKIYQAFAVNVVKAFVRHVKIVFVKSVRLISVFLVDNSIRVNMKNVVKVFVKSVMLNRNSVLPRNVRNVRK